MVLKDQDKTVMMSARNLPNIATVRADMINVYDILKGDTLVVTREAVARIEEVFA